MTWIWYNEDNIVIKRKVDWIEWRCREPLGITPLGTFGYLVHKFEMDVKIKEENHFLFLF